VVRVAAFRDVTVAFGQRYTYRVTAVSDAGNESAASGEVTETAPRD
jgi:fibronectin type 3 domain-containing protein